MLSTPVAGAVGGVLAATAVVALTAVLGDAAAVGTLRSGDGGWPGSTAGRVAAYLGYGLVVGGAFGALATWLGFGPARGALAWLLGGVAWGVVLFAVGVGYRVAVGSGCSAIPLRRALGYDLVFGVVLGGVVGALS